MYLFKSWDKGDKFKQTPQISSTRLNQGLSAAELFGEPNALCIGGF
jgi:hypothetical protein